MAMPNMVVMGVPNVRAEDACIELPIMEVEVLCETNMVIGSNVVSNSIGLGIGVPNMSVVPILVAVMGAPNMGYVVMDIPNAGVVVMEVPNMAVVVLDIHSISCDHGYT